MMMMIGFLYAAPMCDIVCLSVCLFICLPARISQKTTRSILPVAVACSCSDDNVIRYVLPVLWMTSRFHIMEGIDPNQR